jgi:two-component system chemotaxis response regulator CheB
VVIAQHRGADSAEGQLARMLAGRGPLRVRDVEDKDPVHQGCAYLAPPDYHLLVDPDGFALSVDERIAFSRPSVDVLFQSAADAFGERVVAVILTGANEDGAAGVTAVKRRGGVTIAQDPEEAERADMPRAAIATGAIDRVLRLAAIPAALVDLCGVR